MDLRETEKMAEHVGIGGKKHERKNKLWKLGTGENAVSDIWACSRSGSTKDVPANKVVAGVPAKVIRDVKK